MNAIFRLIVRVFLFLAGLVFLASLLVAALLVLALWLVRGLWARLTGRPAPPWTFQVNRQAVWSRFHQAPGQNPAPRREASDVIDVETKEIKPGGE